MKTPCFCTNLRLANRRLSAIYDEALAPLGINIAQFHLLRAIRNHERISLTELGRVVELERSTAGRNVRVLERMGLTASTRAGSDGREARVSLTADGQAMLRSAEPIWADCQDRVAGRIGRDKLAALDSLLDTI